MKHAVQHLKFAGIGCILITLPGCGLIPVAALSTAGAVADVSTAVISTGTEVFAYGKLNSVERTTVLQSEEAVRATAHELELRIELDKDDEQGWQFELADQLDSVTKITIRRRTPAMCELKIDVGFFGSEPLARLLLQRIRSRLPMERPGPATLPSPTSSFAEDAS